jgi:hypothetical protein
VRIADAVLGPFPRVKLHLNRFIAGNAMSSTAASKTIQEMPHLSPRAHEIYAALKTAAAKRKKDIG